MDKPVLTGKRLIEDALPIAAINVVARAGEDRPRRSRTPRKLHLWWARRPLAAARAAVYATLVPADGHDRTPPELADFFDSLCRWGGPESAIRKAREEVLRANGGVPPKVLDLFAGGGAIPLEAARLGCEVDGDRAQPRRAPDRAVMLEYPQAPPRARRRRAPLGQGLGGSCLGQARRPLPTGPDAGAGRQMICSVVSARRSTPLAYLWTRTVRCPNPALARAPRRPRSPDLAGKKKGRMVALEPIVDREALTVTL